MFRKMGLRIRIFLMVTAVMAVSFLAVIGIVSAKSVEMAKNDAFALAQVTAGKYKNEILAELQGARVTSETLASVFESLKDHGLTDRGMMNDILKDALAQKEYITAFCVAYDADMLDGRDALYAGIGPEYDETGRYAPYWNKLEGNIAVQPLHGIDTADWYLVPKATRQEYITDPYPYEVQGRPVMLASFVFPILHRGDFIGFIASDIVLDKLQEMVGGTGGYPAGEYTEILSGSGLVVAHPEKRYLGRDLAAAVVCDMLAREPAKAGAALQRGAAWLNAHPGAEEGDGLFLGYLEALAAAPGTALPEGLSPSAEMATEILVVDPLLLQYVTEVKAAIQAGEVYIASGADYYTVHMPIRFSASTSPWSVAVYVPMAQVLQGANSIRAYMVIVCLVSILASAVVIYLIAGSVTRPILKLTAAAKELGEGNFGAEVPQTRQEDEVGVLSQVFRGMALKIEDLFSRLRAYATELEEKNLHLNRLNEQLVAARDEAEKSNRAKSDFLSNMSHEMRTPLNAVIGMTAIGRAASDLGKKDYAFDKIENASSHLLGVVNDVLDMGKIEANKLELSAAEFNFESMLRKAVGVIIFRLEEKGQVFHVSVDKAIPDRLVGDDQRLRQVITNLLSNAVKFTPEGGSIRLDARLADEDDEGCTVRFLVTDNGIGISPQQQARLFRPFQQADSGTSRTYGGTGLGLAICRRIVELMGGRVWVKSVPGEGSTFGFTVRMPRGRGEVSRPLGADVGWGNVRILVADDDAEVREFFTELAARFGVTCDAVADGDALARLLDAGKRHHIYFIDWRMPGATAAALSRRIKADRGDEAAVIIISSAEWGLIADAATDAGADRFLPKPIFSSDVADCIHSCLGRRPVPSAADGTAPDTFPGRRVLLVEDIEINREILLALLEPTQLTLDCAENGEEALRMFKACPQRYDVIFMDVQMPVMDGLEATRRIRALNTPAARAVPIIAMTANVFREDIEKCLAAGMNDHVGKPLEFEVLLEKLRGILCAGQILPA